MIIYRVPNALLTDYANVGYHLQRLAKFKHIDSDYQHQIVSLVEDAFQKKQTVLLNIVTKSGTTGGQNQIITIPD